MIDLEKFNYSHQNATVLTQSEVRGLIHGAALDWCLLHFGKPVCGDDEISHNPEIVRPRDLKAYLHHRLQQIHLSGMLDRPWVIDVQAVGGQFCIAARIDE